MAIKTSILILMAVGLSAAQRPTFAGLKPIGFPIPANITTTTQDPLGNRFGEDGGTTQRLPIEAQGDRELIKRLSKLPIDKQPFWFINWQALEANRQKPQTYPQDPNSFVSKPVSSDVPIATDTRFGEVNPESPRKENTSNSDKHFIVDSLGNKYF